MLKKIKLHFKKYNIELDNDIIIKFNNQKIFKDKIYLVSAWVFENTKINHNLRLRLHRWLINFAKQNRCYFTIAHNLTLIARIYPLLGHNKKAMESSLKAIEIWEKLNDEPLKLNGIIHNYINLISNYSQIGLDSLYPEYISRAQILIDNENDISIISKLRFYLVLGNLYFELNQLKKSREYYKNALKLAKPTKNINFLTPCNIGLGKILLSQNKVIEAISICNKALIKCKKINDVIYSQIIYFILGECYEKNNDYKKAILNYKKSHQLQIKYSMEGSLGDSLIKIGMIELKNKNYSYAISNFNEIIKLNKYKNNKIINTAYKQLAFCYEKISDYKKSNEYKNQFIKRLEKYFNNKEIFYKENTRKVIQTYNHNLKLIKEENRNLELKNDYEMKQLGLTTGTLVSASFKEFLILLKNKFKEGAEIKHIENLVDCKIMECSNWSDYLMIFEKIRPHFIDKLKDKTNNTITSIEIRICSLIKLGFDKYEISGIIGISPRGVEQHRYRINKKFISINSLNKFIDSL